MKRWRRDGVLSWHPFDQPFFLILNQALGDGLNAPDSSTPTSATMLVDCVRVWG